MRCVNRTTYFENSLASEPTHSTYRAIDWTAGCAAVANGEIDKIWRVVPEGEKTVYSLRLTVVTVNNGEDSLTMVSGSTSGPLPISPRGNFWGNSRSAESAKQ
jgi:hypothetical protein